MLCPVCYGKHLMTINGRRLPCPECAGAGEVHCCDGLREQPADEPAGIEPSGAQQHRPEDSA